MKKHEITRLKKSRNAYKQMYSNAKNQLQEKDYFIEEFRIEIKDLEKDIDFYKASLESKDVQIKKMKEYRDELEKDCNEFKYKITLLMVDKVELEQELQQAERCKTYYYISMVLILIGILCSRL